MPDWRIVEGDCRDVLRDMEANSIDAVVTDPPYGLSPDGKARTWDEIADTRRRGGFMGHAWDAGVPGVTVWTEVLRVLKPGGHMLAFGGARTYHRLACAIEDAGFEIRDTIDWIFGTGMPKGSDIGKAIDKLHGKERRVIGRYQPPGMERPWNLRQARDERTVKVFSSSRNNLDVTAPATEEAARWEGWNTTLKPAHEPIILARKPLDERTVVANVRAWGTGAINIDGTRTETSEAWSGVRGKTALGLLNDDSWTPTPIAYSSHPKGRWPTNVVFSHLPECGELGTADCAPGCPVAELERQSPMSASSGTRGGNEPPHVRARGAHVRYTGVPVGYGDTGGAARFFPTFRYQAKANSRERDAGVEAGLNPHVTVKPVDLMRWLCRLVTPAGGVILDPFSGSGSTGIAAILEGFHFLGIEREPEYCAVARQRIAHWAAQAAIAVQSAMVIEGDDA